MKQKNNFTAKDHTFVICAYKESGVSGCGRHDGQ